MFFFYFFMHSEMTTLSLKIKILKLAYKNIFIHLPFKMQ
jgi:hypothetical protein